MTQPAKRNRAAEKARYERAVASGLCYNCRCRKPEEGFTRCNKCRETTKRRYHRLKVTDPNFMLDNRARAIEWGKKNKDKRSVITRRYRANTRAAVFNHYGNRCACCGEREPLFLCIDHINNDGKAHRKLIGNGGATLHSWLLRNNFPPGFQLLCFNCNCAKGFFGQCPHKKQKVVSA